MVLSIELDDNLWVYSPGQTIKGKVVINKNIWNKVEGLTIRFYGKIEVGTRNDTVNRLPAAAVPESANSSSRNSNFGCVGTARRLISGAQPVDDVVLDHTISLLDSWKVLKPGRHEFNFNYDLPRDLNLPAAFKVKGARIHYEFVTSLKRPRDDFKVYQTPFYICPTIEQYLGENFDEFLQPLEKRAEKELSKFLGCCRGGTFGVEIKFDKRLCSTGGRFTFIVNAWNRLKINLDSVSVSLVREFKYKKAPNFRTKEIVSEICGPALMSGETQIWNGSIQIPSNTPGTSVIRRDTFELNYTIKVVLNPINRPSKKLSVKFPVILLPNNAFIALTMRPSAPAYDETADDHNDISVLPPPTYDEAIQPAFNGDEDSTSHLFYSKS